MFSNKLSQRTSELLVLSVVTLMYIALCAEADMYVPAFPEMVTYFSTTEDKIQLILSLNFAGLCFASMICGPLSDAIGRRKVLLSGMLLFFVSSLGCVFSENFTTMICWRILQGMSASVPMVVACAVFLDKYSLEKASQLIGILNSVITAAMAGAPILGAWITNHFHWRLNFVIIAIIVALSLLGTFLFIDESLPKDKQKPIQIRAILNDYYTLIRSFKFTSLCVIAMLPFTIIVVYISNLSLIFINHLGISPDAFGYYQATTMGTYVIFSALGAKLIAKKGLEYTKNLGSLITITGGTSLAATALFNPTSAILICLSMSVFAAGGSLIVGIFSMKALEIFPDMKGTSSGMMTMIRQLLASVLVITSELSFNGTIVPVAMIAFIYLCVSVLLYCLLQLNPKTKVSTA